MCLVIDNISQRGSVAVMGVFFPWLGQSLEQKNPDLIWRGLEKFIERLWSRKMC